MLLLLPPEYRVFQLLDLTHYLLRFKLFGIKLLEVIQAFLEGCILFGMCNLLGSERLGRFFVTNKCVQAAVSCQLAILTGFVAAPPGSRSISPALLFALPSRDVLIVKNRFLRLHPCLCSEICREIHLTRGNRIEVCEDLSLFLLLDLACGCLISIYLGGWVSLFHLSVFVSPWNAFETPYFVPPELHDLHLQFSIVVSKPPSLLDLVDVFGVTVVAAGASTGMSSAADCIGIS